MDHTTLIERVAVTEERLDGIDDWQGRQNGHLRTLDESVSEINRNIARNKNWLVGLLGAVIVAGLGAYGALVAVLVKK